MKVEIEADIPEGYEATGEYRAPRRGEYYLHESGANCSGSDFSACPWILLRKKKVKRRAKVVLYDSDVSGQIIAVHRVPVEYDSDATEATITIPLK